MLCKSRKIKGYMQEKHLFFFVNPIKELEISHKHTKPQLIVNNRTDVTVKFLHHVKNSTERGVFPRFLLIFAMPLMILLVLNCSTKVSEKSDMENPVQLFVDQELIKMFN